MLTFFPTAYPDELLYSILARYHIRSGNISFKSTMLELFDTKTVTAIIDMPSGMDTLAKKIPNSTRLNSYELLRIHTLFPYYSAFLPEDRVNSILADMKDDGKGGSIHTMAGIMASTISVPSYLRFCPVCIREDNEKFGELHWHRIHQIPGVILCPKHQSIIQDSTIRISEQNRHEFVTAEEHNCPVHDETMKYGDVDFEKMLQLSKDIEWILRNYDTIRAKVISAKGLQTSYLSLLQYKGYATANGRVYQKELLEDFKSFYGDAFLNMIQSNFDCDDENNWLSGIVRKHRKAFHPARHLLFIRFVCNSLDNFFGNTQNYNPFGQGPWPCLNAAAEHYRQNTISKVTVSHCNDTKLPVGTFECTCGFVYSRRGPDISPADVYKIGRIKQFGHVWQEKLYDMAVTEGMGVFPIAKRLRVDPATIKKYIDIVCAEESIADVSKQIEYTSPISDMLRDQYRTIWLELQETHKSASKTELGRIAKSHFMWLYKHDKVWLDNNSPELRLVKSENKRVDWIVRDNRVQKEVEKVVNDILSATEKPVRISLSRIGKTSGLLGLLDRHLGKMPMTEHYLQSVLETDSDYRKRRVLWAIDEISNSGQEPKLWSVLRKAGIRSEYKSEVEELIVNEICENGRRNLN